MYLWHARLFSTQLFVDHKVDIYLKVQRGVGRLNKPTSTRCLRLQKHFNSIRGFIRCHVTLTRPSCGKRRERERERARQRARDSIGERERELRAQRKPHNFHTNLVLSEQAEVRQQKFNTLAKIKLCI